MIELKSESEIEKMRKPGKMVAEVLERLKEMVEPGVSTGYLDSKAETLIGKMGCRSAFKNYRVGTAVFPAVLCTSINEQVVHGIPSDRRVSEGDLLSLDFGVEFGGFYGDAAITVPVGEVSEESAQLVRVTEECLARGVANAAPGKRLGDVGAVVQEHAEEAGYSVVRDFVGHGIGRALHEDPQVPNFGSVGRGRAIKIGMVLAIEPMINMGSAAVRVQNDGWTAVTADEKKSAHFEHTVAVTESGPEVLTKL